MPLNKETKPNQTYIYIYIYKVMNKRIDINFFIFCKQITLEAMESRKADEPKIGAMVHFT